MEHELRELLATLEQRSTGHDRGLLVEQIGDLCFAWDAKLETRELEHVYAIIETLVEQADARVRSKLAEHLSAREDVPHDLLMYLAEDEIDVAYSVLAWSNLLSNDDLIGLVIKHARDHHIAIAQRANIPPSVSEALVLTDDIEVVVTLLRNDGAQFSDDTYGQLAKDAVWVPEYRAPIVEREDVSPEIAGRIYAWLGDALQAAIAERFEFDDATQAKLVADAIAEAVRDARRDSTTPRLKSLGKARIIRASDLLLDLLRTGRMTRFEQDFCALTDLPHHVAYSAMRKSGAKGVAILCKAFGFQRGIFSEMYFHLHGGRSNALFRTTEQYSEAIIYFDNLKVDEARETLQAWKDVPPNPDA